MVGPLVESKSHFFSLGINTLQDTVSSRIKPPTRKLGIAKTLVGRGNSFFWSSCFGASLSSTSRMGGATSTFRYSPIPELRTPGCLIRGDLTVRGKNNYTGGNVILLLLLVLLLVLLLLIFLMLRATSTNTSI